MNGCAGILLTGGRSRRLGRDKARLEVGGRPLAARAAEALAATCRPVVEVGPGITGLPAVRESPAGAGPLAALVTGAEVVGRVPVVLLAVDLPAIAPAVVARLCDAPGTDSVVPRVDGRAQWTCARYGRAALDRARRALARGETALAAMSGAGITWLDDPPWAEVLHDVDDERDLARLVGTAVAPTGAAGAVGPRDPGR